MSFSTGKTQTSRVKVR